MDNCAAQRLAASGGDENDNSCSNPSSLLAGNSFDVLDWGILSGSFSTLVLPSLNAGLPPGFEKDFQKGFADGQNGQEENPTMRIDESLDAYQKGYKAGREEFLETQQEARKSGAGGPAPQKQPRPSHAPILEIA